MKPPGKPTLATLATALGLGLGTAVTNHLVGQNTIPKPEVGLAMEGCHAAVDVLSTALHECREDCS